MKQWFMNRVRHHFGVAAASDLKSWLWSVLFVALFLGALLAGLWKPSADCTWAPISTPGVRWKYWTTTGPGARI